MDVGTWLRDLGQYEQAFRENDIDGDVLADLTADDLSGLGIVSIGHRRKLLAAIATLRAGSPPAMSPSTQPQSAISETVPLSPEGCFGCLLLASVRQIRPSILYADHALS
jgi:SAM domain (Sterile alpha motif)